MRPRARRAPLERGQVDVAPARSAADGGGPGRSIDDDATHSLEVDDDVAGRRVADDAVAAALHAERQIVLAREPEPAATSAVELTWAIAAGWLSIAPLCRARAGS